MDLSRSLCVRHCRLLSVAVAHIVGQAAAILDPSGIYEHQKEFGLLAALGLNCNLTVYDAPYSHSTESSNISTKQSSLYDYILVGAKPMKSDHYNVVAIGPSDAVLKQTSSTTRAHHAGGGVYWYFYPGYSFGFAPSSAVDLGYADRNHHNCSRRMSWHLDNGRAGWSAGCTGGLWGAEISKIVKYCHRVAQHRGMKYLRDRFTVIRAGTWRRASADEPGMLDVAASENYPSMPVKFGAFDATSNSYRDVANFGTLRAVPDALMIWVSSMNEYRDGILLGERRPLEMVFVDSRPPLAKRATQYLVDEVGTRLIVGPQIPFLAMKAAEVAHSNGAVMIAPVESMQAVYNEQPRTFGLAPPANKTFASILADIHQHGAESIGILQESAFPEGACGNVPSLASQNGMYVAWSYMVRSDSGSGVTSAGLQDAFEKIVDPIPDVIFVCTYPEATRLIYQELVMRRLNVSALVFASCILFDNWLDRFGEDAWFVASVCPWLPDSANTTSSLMKQLLDMSFTVHRSASYYHLAASISSAAALLQAAEKAESEDPSKVASALRTMTIETLFGPVEFDENGVNNFSWKVVQLLPDSDELQEVATLQEGGKSIAYPIPPWSMRPCFDRAGSSSAAMHPLGLSSGVCSKCPARQLAVWQPRAWHNMSAFVCEASACLPGSVPDDHDPSTCHACPPGSAAGQGTVCIPCEPGTFSDAEGQDLCKECPAGRFANMTSQTECFLCSPGLATERQGSKRCRLCHEGLFSSQWGSSECTLCKAGTYSDSRASDRCTACAPGQRSNWGGIACSNCSVGKFAMQPGSSECQSCPVGSSCIDSGIVSPRNLPDWWVLQSEHNGTSFQHLLPCSTQGVCLARERCIEGHAGFLCGLCLPGYARLSTAGPCSRCLNSDMQLVLAGICALILVALVICITYVAVESAGQPAAISDVLVKLLMNYLLTFRISAIIFLSMYEHNLRLYALMAIDHSFEFYDATWENYLLEFGTIDFTRSLLTYDCMFQPAVQSSDQSWIDLLHAANHSATFQSSLVQDALKRLADFNWRMSRRQMVFWLFTPIILILLVSFVGLVTLLTKLATNWKHLKLLCTVQQEGIRASIVKSEFRSNFKAMSAKSIVALLARSDTRVLHLYQLVDYAKYCQTSCRKFVVQFCIDSSPLAVVTLFFLYPLLVEYLSAPLHCRYYKHHLTGEGWWMVDKPDLECYRADDFLFWLSISGLVVFVIGVPAYGGWTLFRNQRNRSMAFRRTWGFLMNGYEVGYNYWECVVLLRKAVCVLVAAIGMHEGLRALIFTLFSTFYSLAHLTFLPLDNRYQELLDKVEGRHLIIWWLFSIVIFYLYLSGPSDDTPGEYLWDARQHAISGQIYLYLAMTCLFVLHVCYFCHVLCLIAIHLSENYARFLIKRVEDNKKFTNKVREALDDEPEHARVDGSRAASKAVASMKAAVSVVVDPSKRLEIERHYFENWAYRHNDNYLESKAHLACDPDNLWFAVLGNNSHYLTREPLFLHGVSDGLVSVRSKKAGESQRRFLISILQDAFERIVLSREVSVFSPSLLEFIVRGGFAFDEFLTTRFLVDDIERKGANQDDDRISHSFSSTSRDASTSRLKRGLSKSNSTMSFKSSYSLDIDTQPSIKGSVSRMVSFLSRERRRKQKVQDAEIEIDDLKTMVKLMFHRDVLESALDLEQLQIHLGFLEAVPDVSLRRWLSIFEEEWEQQVHRRLRGNKKAVRRLSRRQDSMFDDSSSSSTESRELQTQISDIYPMAADRSDAGASRSVRLADDFVTPARRVSDLLRTCTKGVQFDGGRETLSVLEVRWKQFVVDLMVGTDFNTAKSLWTLAKLKAARTERGAQERVLNNMSMMNNLRREQAAALKQMMVVEDGKQVMIDALTESLQKERQQLELRRTELTWLRRLLSKPEASLGATGFGLFETRTGRVSSTPLPSAPRYADEDVIDPEIDIDIAEPEDTDDVFGAPVKASDSCEFDDIFPGSRNRAERTCKMICMERGS